MKNNADLISRSARIGLTLEASPEVKKGWEYQVLAAEAATAVIECQNQLKNLVIKCSDLNVSELKLHIQKSFAITLPRLAEVFITHNNVKNYSSYQSIVDFLATHYDAMTCHINIQKDDFIKLYCKVNEVESLPTPTCVTTAAPAVTTATTTTTTQQPESPFVCTVRKATAFRQRGDDEVIEERDDRNVMYDANGSQTVPVVANLVKATILDSLRATVETIYISSWNAFLNHIKINERTARLKHLAKE